ncbi:MAG: DUF6541 family protein [Candidatus Micrarchaeia archaeon]
MKNKITKVSNNAPKALGLLAVLLFSTLIAYHGLFEIQDFMLPTYDNAMLHAGRAREVIETTHWAEIEAVFGGITKSYHLPAYPVLIAILSLLSGLNWAMSIKLTAMIMSILFPLGFYFLGKEISGGNWMSGVAAAFLALNATNLMTWGTRTTPISLGVTLIPFLLYFVLKKRLAAALLISIILALTHQPSLLAAVSTLFLYTVFNTILVKKEEFEKLLKKGKITAKNTMKSIQNIYNKQKWTANFSGLTLFFVYIAWHIRQTGLSCLNFSCLPQADANEFGKSIDLAEHFFKLPQAPAILGVPWLLLDKKINNNAKTLVIAWLVATLLLVKNDVIFELMGGSGGVFTERFLTYLDEAAAILGGIFIGGAFKFFAGE